MCEMEMQTIAQIVQAICAIIVTIVGILAYKNWKKKIIGSKVYDNLVKIRLHLAIIRDTIQYWRFKKLFFKVETEEQKTVFKKHGECLLLKVNKYATIIEREVEKYKATGNVDDNFLRNELDMLQKKISDLAFSFEHYLVLLEGQNFKIHEEEYQKAEECLFKSGDLNDKFSEELNGIINDARQKILTQIEKFFK